MPDQQQVAAASLRFQQGDQVQVVKGIGAGLPGEITAVYPTADKPYVVKVDSAYIRHSDDDLASLPVDGP